MHYQYNIDQYWPILDLVLVSQTFMFSKRYKFSFKHWTWQSYVGSLLKIILFTRTDSYRLTAIIVVVFGFLLLLLLQIYAGIPISVMILIWMNEFSAYDITVKIKALCCEFINRFVVYVINLKLLCSKSCIFSFSKKHRIFVSSEGFDALQIKFDVGNVLRISTC